MVALTVVFLLVVTAVLSPGKPSRCGVRSGPDFATAVSRVSGCPAASGGSQGMARPYRYAARHDR
jgi:hypothetical protein